MRVADTRRQNGIATPTSAPGDASERHAPVGRTAPDRAAGLLHDLRDALSTVTSAALLLRSGELPAEQAPYLTAIEAAAEKMVALTEMIAETRIGAAATVERPVPATPAPEDMTALAAQIRATLAVRCEAMGIASRVSLGPEVPPSVSLDKVRLMRVLDNLIANAATATRGRPDGLVHVDIGMAKDRLAISVIDTGPGLGTDPERWFAKGESGSQDSSGLGLWVARRSAEAMAAELAARNGRTGGAVFTLYLPADVGAGDGLEGAPASVLVVDGNPVGREFMRAVLASIGAQVVLAGSIAEAVERAQIRPFALAVTDVRLPDGEGRDLARRLRALQPDLRIAATGGSAEATAAIAEGLFAGLLQKPVDPRALARLLNEARETAPVSSGESGR